MENRPGFRRTRAAWGAILNWRHRTFRASRYRLPRMERAGTVSLLVMPEVFNGVLLKSGAFFAGALDRRLIPAGIRVLDVGTGSGIVAIRAAQLGARVMAVDINPDAIRCARINVLLNRVENVVQLRVGDLFEPVRGEKFDRILFNPPFYRQVPRSALEAAWRSTDVFDRFLDGLDEMMSPGGFALILLSSLGDLLPALESVGAGAWCVKAAAHKDVLHEIFTLYRVGRKVAPVRDEERVQSEA